MILEELRRAAFWALDSLKGGHIKKAYEQIALMDRTPSSSNIITNHHQDCFAALADHTRQSVPFYMKGKGESLQDFPIINKSIIKENQNDFLSNKFQKNELVSMHTSGSTGTPFHVYQDAIKKKHVHAEIIYYSEKVGYKVGYPLIYFRAIKNQASKNTMKQFAQNQWVFDCSDLSPKGIRELLKKLEKLPKHSVLLAYASTYDEMRKYFTDIGYGDIKRIKLSGIISGAVMLNDQTREAMETAFRCKCVSRYSNQENGVLGQDEEENNVFIVNEASYIVEIINLNEDTPACPGEVGRIVVTDLHNFAMPMIRYDTGDVGKMVLVNTDRGEKNAIADFGGRRMDMIYDCKDQVVSPHTISTTMLSFAECRSFQFVQEERGTYVMRIHCAGTFEREKELNALLLNVLGSSAKIEIEYVDEVPILPSGKRKYIVSHYSPNE